MVGILNSGKIMKFRQNSGKIWPFSYLFSALLTSEKFGQNLAKI